MAAALAGKLAGAATTTITIRNAVADSKARVTATVDSDGNRSGREHRPHLTTTPRCSPLATSRSARSPPGTSRRRRRPDAPSHDRWRRVVRAPVLRRALLRDRATSRPSRAEPRRRDIGGAVQPARGAARMAGALRRAPRVPGRHGGLAPCRPSRRQRRGPADRPRRRATRSRSRSIRTSAARPWTASPGRTVTGEADSDDEPARRRPVGQLYQARRRDRGGRGGDALSGIDDAAGRRRRVGGAPAGERWPVSGERACTSRA
jgi:hypothetical protein